MCRNFSIFKTLESHSQPFQRILHVAKSIADPAQAIQYRGIIRHQLSRTLDIVERFFQPFCPVCQRVSQCIKRIRVLRFSGQQLEQVRLGDIDTINLFRHQGTRI